MIDNITLRSLAMAANFMVFASSVIVTGIVSYFLHEYSFRDTHIIYQEVIATISLAVYTFSFILPFIRSYHGYLLPFNFAFTYLWLTSFIFASEDWAGGRCRFNGPTAGKCRLKKTVVAFDFLAFFFLLCTAVAEGLLWRVSGTESSRHVAEPKERPVSGTTVGSTPAVGNTPAIANNV